ncbi:MAG: hypothetical protein ACR2IV_05215 [Bryobacteraceae bacterium]
MTIPTADSANQGGIRMWPSEELASRLYDLANWGLILGLVIGVVSTVFLVWMGNVKESYLRKSLTATSSVAARANERAEVLESANLGLRADLEHERQKTARLNRDVEDERARRVELEDREEWRKLSDKQQSRLAARLSPFAGQPAVVGFQAGNLEANLFALDITAALRKAKWDVPLPVFWPPSGDVGGAKFGPISRPKTGVSILSSPQTQSETLAKTISAAFNDLGFDAVVDARHLSPMQPPPVAIVVEFRPTGKQGAAKLATQHGRAP